MPSMTTSRVRRRDQQGREHVVRVEKAGARRQLTCCSCDWRRNAQFLPWLKAQEHLAQEHRATVDPAVEG